MLPVLMTSGNQTKSRFYHIHELCLFYKQDTSCLLLSTTENQAQAVILRSIFFLCSKWFGIMKANHVNISSGFAVWLSGVCWHPDKWQSFQVALRATKNQYFNCINSSMTQLCWVCNTGYLKHPQALNFAAGSFLGFSHTFPEHQLSTHKKETLWLVCPVTSTVSVGGVAEELRRNCRVDFTCWTCRRSWDEVLKLPSRNNIQTITC